MNQKDLHTFLKTWLDKVLGKPQIFTITFDIDFVTGNLIDTTIGVTVLATVPFNTSHAQTLQDLATAIQATSEIFSAIISGERQLTITGAVNGTTLTGSGPTVTGGAAQAVFEFSEIQAAVGVVSYLMFQNSPKKFPYPYATYDILSSKQIGWDQTEAIDPATNLVNIGGWRRVMIRINYFGKYAFEAIMKASQSLEKPTIKDLFFQNGYSIHEKASVQNLSTMLETIWEESAAFDFALGLADNVKDDLGVIESVKLTGTVETGQDNDVTIGPEIISG